MADATIGVDLGGTKALFVRGERASRIDPGPAFARDELAARLASFGAEDGEPPSRIGIAVPGLVDGNGRIVACDVLPALAGWSPRAALAGPGYAHVAVVNDVRAALLEEMHDAPAGVTAAVVMVGTGVGAAFVAHGQPLLGTSGWAGVGHLPCAFGGEPKRLDEIAGGAAMASIAELWRDGTLARVRAGERVVAFGARRAAAIDADDTAAARR